MSQKDTIGILIVDDDQNFVDKYVKPALSKENDWTKKALPNLDFDVEWVDSQEAAQDKIEHDGSKYHIAGVDLRLKKNKDSLADSDKTGGLKILDYINQRPPRIKVIMFTSENSPLSVQTAFEAITQRGAFDYLFKAQDQAFQRQLLLAVSRAWKYIELERRVIDAGGIVGESPAMNRVKDLIAKVADSDAPVLITGESGTGKELASRAIHQNSSRRDKPFVPVNSAAIPRDLLEAEIFGACEGAYSGAVEKEGALERANHGTLFLDEIGDLALEHQAKLLRVIESKHFSRVGGLKASGKHREDHTNIEVDVRIVAATNQPLKEKIQSKEFREELFYRLNVIQIEMPPLRDRKEDIPLLVDHFIQKYRDKEDKFITGISDAGKELLMKYDWSGNNVRELENTIWRAIILSNKQVLDVEILQEAIGSVAKELQMIDELPTEIKNKINELFCQEYNEWCMKNGKGSRRIKREEILGILGLAYNEKKVRVSKCKDKPLGLEHTKASTALAFLASKKFLTRKTERGPYSLGEQFAAHA
jgi:DNA-binding NtrC family response regulator